MGSSVLGFKPACSQLGTLSSWPQCLAPPSVVMTRKKEDTMRTRRLDAKCTTRVVSGKICASSLSVLFVPMGQYLTNSHRLVDGGIWWIVWHRKRSILKKQTSEELIRTFPLHFLEILNL